MFQDPRRGLQNTQTNGTVGGGGDGEGGQSCMGWQGRLIPGDSGQGEGFGEELGWTGGP